MVALFVGAPQASAGTKWDRCVNRMNSRGDKVPDAKGGTVGIRMMTMMRKKMTISVETRKKAVVERSRVGTRTTTKNNHK